MGAARYTYKKVLCGGRHPGSRGMGGYTYPYMYLYIHVCERCVHVRRVGFGFTRIADEPHLHLGPATPEELHLVAKYLGTCRTSI